MAKWLSKDPDAFLPDRPPASRHYSERAREHMLRRDGPPHARDWRELAPPWVAGMVFLLVWAAGAYLATLAAGATAALDTVAIAFPILFLARSDALRWGGAALHERRSYPTWKGRPLGGAPWLAVFSLHLACVFGFVAVVALASSDEGNERLAVIAAGFVAGAAGWLLDVVWGRADRRLDGLPPRRPNPLSRRPR